MHGSRVRTYIGPSMNPVDNLHVLAFLWFAGAATFFFIIAQRFFARSQETWLVAVVLAVLPGLLIPLMCHYSLLLGRTPALIYLGFAGLVTLWGVLRNGKTPGNPPAIPPGTLVSLAAIPLSGTLVAFILMEDDVSQWWSWLPFVMTLAHGVAIGIARLVVGRRAPAAGESSDMVAAPHASVCEGLA